MVAKALRLLLAVLLAAQLPCLLTSCNKPTADGGEADATTTAGDAGALGWLRAADSEDAVLFEYDEVDAILGGDDPLVLTGDELTDRVLQWLEEFRQSCESLESPLPFSDMHGELLDWEVEFSPDPRYWHLRYLTTWFLADAENESPDRSADTRQIAMIKELAKALEHDAADITALVILWMQSGKYPEILGGDRWDLLDQMEELSPDSAWPHYLRAFALLDADIALGAFENIKYGNRQLTLEPLAAFPCGVLGEHLADGQPLGDLHASYILSLLLSLPGEPQFALGWQIGSLTDRLRSDELGLDGTIQTELNEAVMRIVLSGPSRRPVPMDMMAAGWATMMDNVYRANNVMLSVENQDALAQMAKAEDNLLQYGLDLMEHSGDSLDRTLARAEDEHEDQAVVRKLMMIDMLEQTYWEITFVETHYRPWFRALRELDFTDLRPLPELDRLIDQRSH